MWILKPYNEIFALFYMKIYWLFYTLCGPSAHPWFCDTIHQTLGNIPSLSYAHLWNISLHHVKIIRLVNITTGLRKVFKYWETISKYWEAVKYISKFSKILILFKSLTLSLIANTIHCFPWSGSVCSNSR